MHNFTAVQGSIRRGKNFKRKARQVVMAIIRVIRGCGERHYVRSGTVVFCRWWKLFRRLQSGIRRKTRLTIHGECHSLANGGRHVVASDAQIRPHLSPLDTMELQQRTVVGLVLLESATTCAPRKRFLSAYFLENRPPPMHTHTHTHDIHLLASSNASHSLVSVDFLSSSRIAFHSRTSVVDFFFLRFYVLDSAKGRDTIIHICGKQRACEDR